MKQAFRLIAALFVFCVAFSVPAFAEGDAEPAPIPIKEALELPDKSPVALEGYIVKSLAPHKYILAQDDGEQVRVKIDADAWGGEPTGEKDLIVVYGEFTKHGNSREIEVDKVVRK